MNELPGDAAGGLPDPPPGVLHEALEAGLRRVAATRRLLVASDFDGTLADLVDRPDAVVPDAAAVAALRSLAELPETRVAVVSGRSRTVLEEFLGHTELVLVGSHGAEFPDDVAPGDERGAGRDDVHSEAEVRRALEEVSSAFEALAAEYAGALVERKPTAVAFHYRQVDASRQDEAARRAAGVAGLTDPEGSAAPEDAAGPGPDADAGSGADRDGPRILRLQPGHMVVELVAGDANKGAALDTLRRAVDATATVFVGDDRTDEHAFARLGPSDLAVKIGSGTTSAPVRIPSRADVAPLFRRLHVLRSVGVRSPSVPEPDERA